MLIRHYRPPVWFNVILHFVAVLALAPLFFSTVRPCFYVLFAVFYVVICRLSALKRWHVASCPVARFCAVSYNVLVFNRLCYALYFLIFLS